MDFKTHYPFIKYIYEKRKGIGGARNTGLDIAKGNWVVFIDDGNILSKDYLKESAELLEKNPHLDALCSKEIRIDDGPIAVASELDRDAQTSILNKFNFISLSAGGVIILKNIFDRIGKYDEELITFEDFELTWRAYKHKINIIRAPNIYIKHHYRANLISLYLQYFNYGRGWFRFKRKVPDCLL